MSWPLWLILGTCLQSILVIQLFVEDVSRRFGFSEDLLGVFAFVEVGAVALASLLVFMFPSFWRKAAILIASLALLVANTACVWLDSPIQFILARSIMGFSAGLICSWAYRQSLFYGDTARTQGYGVMFQSVFLVVTFFLAPRLVEQVNGALYGVVSVWFCILVVAVYHVKHREPEPHTEFGTQSSSESGLYITLYHYAKYVVFAAAVIAIYVSHGAFDTFIIELGVQQGLKLVDLGYAMIGACAIGIPTGALVGYLGARLGYLLPLMLSVAFLFSSILLLYNFSLSLGLFWWVVLLYNFGWVASFPFIILLAEQIEKTGRLVSGTLVMIAVGLSLGALWSGELAVQTSLTTSIIWVVSVAAGLALVFFGLTAFLEMPKNKRIE